MRTWKEQKNYLCKLIKRMSDENGGDESEWLKEYAREVIKNYADNLDVAIKCFEDLCRKEAICVVGSQAKDGGKDSSISMEIVRRK